MVSKEASTENESVVGGISTGQREEACEASLLSANVHEGRRSNASDKTNRAAKVATVSLAVALCVNKLTIEDLLLLGHKFGMQRDVFVLHFL